MDMQEADEIEGPVEPDQPAPFEENSDVTGTEDCGQRARSVKLTNKNRQKREGNALSFIESAGFAIFHVF